MNAPDPVTWMGAARIVKARVVYTAAAIPFLPTLPVKALFELAGQREMVILSSQDDSLGEYYFDVETGLMLSQTVAVADAVTMLTLAEINYDFATHRAFAEDTAPHTAYGGMFSAGYMGFLSPNSGGFQITTSVISRDGSGMVASVHIALTNVAGAQNAFFDYYLGYAGQGRDPLD